jgi:3D (Asp-Asp-Asp) domain-containing protein
LVFRFGSRAENQTRFRSYRHVSMDSVFDRGVTRDSAGAITGGTIDMYFQASASISTSTRRATPAA